MRRCIGTGSALLLGMLAFGSAPATACDWGCWWGRCGASYGYYAPPVYGYYARPSYTYYAPAPAYYAPAPAYYADPGYAADVPPPVSRPPGPYYAAAQNYGYERYAHTSYPRPAQALNYGKWDQSASMLGGPRKNVGPVANPAGQAGKATITSHGGAQNKAPATGSSTLAVSPPTAKNGRLAKLSPGGGMPMSSTSRHGSPGVRYMAVRLRDE